MSDLIERLRYATIDRDTPKLLTKAADELERLNKCLQWEQNRAERIGTHGTDCYKWGHNHYECALKEIERLKRENEELRAKYEKLSKLNLAQHEMYEKDNNALHDELAALKAQSTEPVAWFYEQDGYVYTEYAGPVVTTTRWDTYSKESWTETPLYTTPPTATALVEDFRKRAVEVCKQHNRVITCITVVQRIQNEIESLPLIEGEK